MFFRVKNGSATGAAQDRHPVPFSGKKRQLASG
jgi:hypothetical protein